MLNPTPEPTAGSPRFLFIRNPGAQLPCFWRFLYCGLLMVLGAAVLHFIKSGNADAEEKLSVMQLESGHVPPSSWVSVEGRLLRDDAAYEGSEEARTCYVPMVSSGWRRSDNVKVFVKAGSDAVDGWGETERIEGHVTTGLPDFVRTFFAMEGPYPADDAVLLRVGTKPGQDQRLAHILLAFGLLSLGGAIGVYNPNATQPAQPGDALQKPLLLGPRASDLAELRGQVAPDDPKIREREDAVQVWMREHGLKPDDADKSAESATEVQPA